MDAKVGQSLDQLGVVEGVSTHGGMGWKFKVCSNPLTFCDATIWGQEPPHSTVREGLG